MTIYTRRGDAGQTSLFSGERIGKDDLRVQTYGAVDELQAHLGMVIALSRSERVRELLREVQEDIVLVCAQLASSPRSSKQLSRQVGRADAVRLEHAIDEFVRVYHLPNGFIRPGASADSAAAHVARAVSRRCERFLTTLNREVGGFDELAVYLNRLSDFMFAVAWSLEVDAVLDEIVNATLSAEGAEPASWKGSNR